MSLRRIKDLDESERLLLIQACSLPGAVIAQVARNHQVSAKSLYYYLQRQALRHPTTEDKIDHSADFVELIPASLRLRRADLCFGDVQISVEGTVCTSLLSTLIQSLEGSC